MRANNTVSIQIHRGVNFVNLQFSACLQKYVNVKIPILLLDIRERTRALQIKIAKKKQVFRVKNLWGCRPNSKYLLPSVAALSLTIGKHDIVS